MVGTHNDDVQFFPLDAGPELVFLKFFPENETHYTRWNWTWGHAQVGRPWIDYWPAHTGSKFRAGRAYDRTGWWMYEWDGETRGLNFEQRNAIKRKNYYVIPFNLN